MNRHVSNEHVKRCSTSAFGEMQITSAMRHHSLTWLQKKQSKKKEKCVGEDMEKLDPLYTASRNVKTVQRILKNLMVPQKANYIITIQSSNSTP